MKLIQDRRLCTSLTYMQSPLCFNVALVLLHALLVQFSDMMHLVIICFLLTPLLVILQLLHERHPLRVTLLALLITPLLFCSHSRAALFLVGACIFNPFRLSPFEFSCHCSEIRLNLCVSLLHCFLCALRICPVHEQ